MLVLKLTSGDGTIVYVPANKVYSVGPGPIDGAMIWGAGFNESLDVNESPDIIAAALTIERPGIFDVASRQLTPVRFEEMPIAS